MSTNYHTAISGSAFGLTTANLESRHSDLDQAITDIVSGAEPLSNEIVVNASELTISSGAVTVTQYYHTIDTESDAASDDLTDIAGGTAGQKLLISANHTDRTVVVKHDIAKIALAGGADISLSDTELSIELIYTGSYWKMIGYYEASTGEANPSYAKLWEQQTANTHAGNPAGTGTYYKRTLNQEYDPDGIVTVSSSVFTLAAGTYRIKATVPAIDCNAHKARLRNTTDSTTEIIGTSEYSLGTDFITTRSLIDGEFTIAGTKNFELQHAVGALAAGAYTLGYASNLTEVEIYAVVEIWKMP